MVGVAVGAGQYFWQVGYKFDFILLALASAFLTCLLCSRQYFVPFYGHACSDRHTSITMTVFCKHCAIMICGRSSMLCFYDLWKKLNIVLLWFVEGAQHCAFMICGRSSTLCFYDLWKELNIVLLWFVEGAKQCGFMICGRSSTMHCDTIGLEIIQMLGYKILCTDSILLPLTWSLATKMINTLSCYPVNN